MDINDKEQFQSWLQRAVASPTDDNYIELYNILLRSFTAADSDYDGQVSAEEFHTMVEAAGALPRKFGYSWWGEDDSDRARVCQSYFQQIDENGDGSVSFEEWLGFALGHYKGKAEALPQALDCLGQEDFVSACRSQGKKVYWFMWKCFQSADIDRDGLVSQEEFDKMILMATSAITRAGLPDPFPTQAERTAVFRQIDQNGDGSVSADEWLGFCGKEIIGKI